MHENKAFPFVSLNASWSVCLVQGVLGHLEVNVRPCSLWGDDSLGAKIQFLYHGHGGLDQLVEKDLLWRRHFRHEVVVTPDGDFLAGNQLILFVWWDVRVRADLKQRLVQHSLQGLRPVKCNCTDRTLPQTHAMILMNLPFKCRGVQEIDKGRRTHSFELLGQEREGSDQLHCNGFQWGLDGWGRRLSQLPNHVGQSLDVAGEVNQLRWRIWWHRREARSDKHVLQSQQIVSVLLCLKSPFKASFKLITNKSGDFYLYDYIYL